MARRISLLSVMVALALVSCVLPGGPTLVQRPATTAVQNIAPGQGVEQAPASELPALETTAPAESAPPTEEAQAAESEALATSTGKPFVIQPGSPSWLSNFAHPEAGCDWLGVAGQVFDAQGGTRTSLVVRVGGVLEGSELVSLSLAGAMPSYGPGGYEIVLSDRPVETSGDLWVQLLDLDGNELSERYSFTTFEDCNRNLVLINFLEIATQPEVIIYYYPLFYSNYEQGPSSPRGESGASEDFEELYFPLLYYHYEQQEPDIPAP